MAAVVLHGEEFAGVPHQHDRRAVDLDRHQLPVAQLVGAQHADVGHSNGQVGHGASRTWTDSTIDPGVNRNLLLSGGMNPLYLLLEIGAATFFVLAAWLAMRRGRLPFLELISAATFGLLLEEGDQLIFETYHYADAWVLSIDRAPLVIGLTWALIIAGAMRITDALGVRRRWAPFVDSVLAIMLDLAFDAVAIRMGLWTWRGVPATDGWFGVPAGNFYAWLFVTWAFSFFTRWLRDASTARRALRMAPAGGADPRLRALPRVPGAVQPHQAARRPDSGRRQRCCS